MKGRACHSMLKLGYIIQHPTLPDRLLAFNHSFRKVIKRENTQESNAMHFPQISAVVLMAASLVAGGKFFDI